jgi:hypothetical protein
MSLYSELAERFARERRRTASILRETKSLAEKGEQSTAELFEIAARHIELGDDYGTLWGECKRCHGYDGEPLREEFPFGSDTFHCRECRETILPIKAIT